MTNEDIGFLSDFIAESDAIEGIQDDRDMLTEEIMSGSRKDGHVVSLLKLHELAAKKSTLINEVLVKQTQRYITKGQHLKPGAFRLDKRHVGAYRDVQVRVAHRLGTPPREIEDAMRSLVACTALLQLESLRKSKTECIHAIAQFHFDFEIIHPFVDGNGRTGRALVYYLYRNMGLRPFIFTSRDRHDTYYPSFQNQKTMERYFILRSPDARH